MPRSVFLASPSLCVICERRMPLTVMNLRVTCGAHRDQICVSVVAALAAFHAALDSDQTNLRFLEPGCQLACRDVSPTILGACPQPCVPSSWRDGCGRVSNGIMKWQRPLIFAHLRADISN
jgi:hypothetical protein